MNQIKVCVALCLIGFNSFNVLSQDSHYGTYQFGTRSALMGGAVIGFTRDNTSIFYNPGSLAFVDSNSITITANVYQVENYRITNASGVQKDLSSSQISSVPLMVGGMVGTGMKRIRIGYGVISPVNFNFKTTSRISGKFPVVEDVSSPGNEEFVGQSSINSQLSEVAGILGVGYKINPHWAIGLSNLAIGRTQDFSRSTFARYYLNDLDNNLSSYSFLRNANYFHLRYVAKLGLSYRFKQFSAGLTVTTPSIGVYGDGTVTADVIGTNIIYDDKRRNLLANDRQENLGVTYKSPLSIALGANLSHKKNTFGFSVQYYGKVGVYTVMNVESDGFISPTDFYERLGNQDFLRLRDGARQVLNFSLGYEYRIKRGLAFVTSFRSNRSFYDKSLNDWRGIKTEITTWDLYHVTAGLILKQGHSQLSVGLLYGIGVDKSRPQNGEFSVPEEVNFSNSPSVSSKASYNSFGFLLGYSFLLFDI